MKRLILVVVLGVLTASFGSGITASAGKAVTHKSTATTRSHRRQPVTTSTQTTTGSRTLKTATTRSLRALSPQPLLSLSDYTPQGTVDFTPFSPQLVAVDPYANVASSSDGLKPARPFWYEVDSGGLTIRRTTDNGLVYRVPWPATIDVVQPDGEFVNLPAPPSGWEPVGITVSYPTEEQLASNSETPATYVYVVMAHSGYEWQSNATPPDLRDPGLRDELVATTNPATESSMLVQVDVTDPSFLTLPPSIAAAILGHGAGQPAFDPATGNVYVGNMPSTSLPTTPRDLTSFVSVIAPLAPPAAEAGGGELPGAPEAPLVVICGPEHPDLGVLAGVPVAWACVESGDGPARWEFANLPNWLTAHPDKLTGQLDGILYGTPVVGTYPFQARVTDYGEDPVGVTSEWATYTLEVTLSAPSEEGEGGFEVGVPGAQALQGTGSCDPGPTLSPGSMVPNWIDVATVPNGCVVMGTAPVSGEYYEFQMPGFNFAYPFDLVPVIFSGSVAGPYVFDPVPMGVSISGLAWHEIDKIHDPSTEADILNAEFFGVDPFTGQMYRILPPQGAPEGSSAAVLPPETSIEGDEVSASGEPLLPYLTASRADIAAALAAHPNLKVKFGDLAVEANRDPRVYVSARELADPTGVDPTVIPIGGLLGSTIEHGAMIKVSGTRDVFDPTVVAWSTIGTIDLAGVQSSFLALDSNLSPAVRGSEPGQVDHGFMWVTGTSTANVAVVDTAAGTVGLSLTVPNATSLGGVSVDFISRAAYVAAPSASNVTIFGIGTPTADAAPMFWGVSPNVGIEVTFNLGVYSSYSILATGWPTPAITYLGTLPVGVTLVDNGNGTATLSGTPGGTAGADYTVDLSATNRAGTATTPLILTVQSPPAITSVNTATFVAGVAGSFTITTSGGPAPSFTCPASAEAGAGEPAPTCDPLPDWLTFTDNDDGTATLTGTPPFEAVGTVAFTIIVTNDIPPDATQLFTLLVAAPGSNIAPSITMQPSSLTVVVGQTATFTSAASGYPVPTVQWELSTDAGATWSPIAGATNTSYTTDASTMAMNGYQYLAVFTNTAGTVPSNAVTLTVSATAIAPAITMQPSNATVAEGQLASFASAASGSPTPTVQWELSTNGGATWSPITGATSTNYITGATTTAMNGYEYRAVFTNSAGSIATNAAILTVNVGPAPPLITAQPASVTVTAGQTATFTAAASGNPTPTVQWQLSTNGGANWSDIAGATNTSYTTAATTTAMNGYRYRALFTNTGGTAYSQAAALTVNAPGTAPTVTTQPLSVTVTVGQTATFTSAASGTPTPTMQWQLSTDGATWGNIAGATSTSYNTGATTIAMNGYRYRAAFTNGSGTVYSNAAVLTVNVPQIAPTFTSASSTTFTAGSAGSFQVTTTGSPTPTLSYWGMLPTGVTFTNNGNGTATLAGTPAAGTQGTYMFTITASNTVDDAYQNFTLNVNPAAGTAPAVTTQPVSQTVTAGQSVTFTSAANGTPTPTVQWQLSTDGGATWANIAGATSTSYSTGATTTAMSGYQYHAVFTNTGGTATSNAATLTVNAAGTAPVVTTQPISQTVTAGQRATFTSAASGTPTPTVQWEVSTNGGVNWSNIAGATSTSYMTPVTTTAMSGYQYRAVFTNSAGSVPSNAAVLTVNAAVQALTVSTNSLPRATVGSSYTVTLQATGGTPPYTWSVSGSLPAGLTLSPAGVLSGTPTASGNSRVTFQVTDSASNVATRTLNVRVERSR